jgi:hypothetical protein
MSTKKSEFLLLFRGEDWDKGMPPELLQQTMDNMIAWLEGLKTRGILKGGRPLARTGKTVSGPGKPVVSDGPFAESKEAVGGYVVLEVTEQEAIAAAKSYPALDYGITVEVRPLLDECPCFARVNKKLLELANA